MADYKVYNLDSDGHIRSAEWIEAEDDAAAIAILRDTPANGDRELWREARKLGLFRRSDPHDAATPENDPASRGADRRQGRPDL